MADRDSAILKKILEEALMITRLIEGCDYAAFSGDEKTKRAVCMTLINIGEMVKLLKPEVRDKNPSIPWRSLAGLRDVTAHGYQTLRMEDIWDTVVNDIPVLREQLRTMLAE
jgi:uncharacterized protein with HEPN domain